jgi:hypothetical protein
MGTRRIDAVRIATIHGIVEIPWESSQELRGRLLASGLELLEDEFAAKGTNCADRRRRDLQGAAARRLAWIEDLGEEQAVALGGLLALRDALRADLAAPAGPAGGRRRARPVVDSSR